MDRVPVRESFGGQRRPEIGVVGLDQLDRELPDAWVMAPVQLTASGLMDQPEPAVLLVAGQQPVRLTLTDAQHGSRSGHRTSAGLHLVQNFNTPDLALAHPRPRHP